MRYTLIEMVQRLLESMDSDEVNDIADTPESMAVANIIKSEYFKLIGELEPKETENLFQLDASTDNLLPTVMYLPAGVANIQRLKYNIGESPSDSNFRDLTYLPIMEFVEYMNALDETQTYVGNQRLKLGATWFNLKFRNDVSPFYWTCPDDLTIIMDSFDSTKEETLTSVRTLGYGALVPEFHLLNTFIPKLAPKHFQLLLDKSKVVAFVELKQTDNVVAEKDARRGMILAKKTSDQTDNRPEILKHRGFGRVPSQQPDRRTHRGTFR